jgi:hypothetical protein|tara:strand:+ start:4072 stop:4473 length:402 start_codon:yes stop_codon:yes gene_type:complete
MKNAIKNISNYKLITAFIASCLLSATALAKDDCTDPVTDWQPKEQLRQIMEDKGWDVKRIKVDDGCYEIKGLDRNGHEVEAKFSPASLRVIELEIKFNGSGDTSDYLDLDVQNGPKEPGTKLNSKNKAKAIIN